jgi:hypothetical protein
MIPHKLTERFARLETSIAARKGDFVFFALFLREGAPNRWDLLVAAPWLGEDRNAAVGYLVDEIKSTIGADALLSLSRIIVIDPYHEEVQEFNRHVKVEHGDVEIRDRDIFGQTIKEAHVITSKLPAAPVVK